ncbi:hypothetical protein PBY51_000606 [Eleginops maclovinus]|uniref:Uncharacterized protein n=1 Tax=Eleginops maclovinus TaxID=56733 RepID=A0AAN7XHU0_ELEMC|nr:hypothetical protein PBY51_000606 [Eleginops maclovinus]
MQNLILQTGIPVSTAPKCPPSGSHSTAYVCTPHCRKEGMRFHRNFHKDGWNGPALQSLW